MALLIGPRATDASVDRRSVGELLGATVEDAKLSTSSRSKSAAPPKIGSVPGTVMSCQHSWAVSVMAPAEPRTGANSTGEDADVAQRSATFLTWLMWEGTSRETLTFLIRGDRVGMPSHPTAFWPASAVL